MVQKNNIPFLCIAGFFKFLLVKNKLYIFSAGVGRTGVFIALDILLEKLNRESVIDVFETVSRLRESRTSMVKTGEQYLTIYEVIAAAIRKRASQRF